MNDVSSKAAMLDEAGFIPPEFDGRQNFTEPLPFNGAEWEPPMPFETADTPDFPTESLPGPVAAYVEALAESTQTPDEMAAVLSLGVLATAFQSKFTVEITSDWTEPLCLYLVAIAPPGERKSAVISRLLQPVYDYEDMRREDEAAMVKRNQTERAMLEKALQNAQTEATKKKSSAAECRDEALALSDELAGFVDMHPFRLLADDSTPEKLIDLMDTQGGCITVASAEGGVFDALSGRYDKVSNFDVYLKGHSGDPVTVDRIGRKHNHIKNPRLTMILTIQPEVLGGLISNATYRGRGLCGRFLYAMCRSKVGRRNINPEPVPQQVKDEYSHFVKRILSSDYNGTGTIRISSEAHKVRLAYTADIEKRLVGDLEHMQDWGGKLLGATMRIAALIHAAEAQGNPADTPIGLETMTAAIRIAEFLCAHAEAAYQSMGADEAVEGAKYILRRIESSGLFEISRRDLWRMCKSKYKRSADMDVPVYTLVEMGYVKEVELSTGGRPTKILYLNPKAKRVERAKSPV